MTDSNAFDFTKFVPGFDFLKNLTPQASSNGAGVPGWVAPTLDPKEIDKRIQELKTVQFWLEQNAKGIAATIQAMEVQRMTLSTLQNMNVNFQDMAESLKVKPINQAASEEEKPQAKTAAKDNKVDPTQWWGALTEQFQHIATHAMKDMATHASTHATNAVPKNFPAKKTTASNKSRAGTASSAKRKSPTKTSTPKPKASR